MLHGGAVDINGSAIAVVGHSGAGKSTFTAAMTRAGHRYLADEVVAVDDSGSVLAFHRPIGLRRGGAEQMGSRRPGGSVRSHSPVPRRARRSPQWLGAAGRSGATEAERAAGACAPSRAAQCRRSALRARQSDPRSDGSGARDVPTPR